MEGRRVRGREAEVESVREMRGRRGWVDGWRLGDLEVGGWVGVVGGCRDIVCGPPAKMDWSEEYEMMKREGGEERLTDDDEGRLLSALEGMWTDSPCCDTTYIIQHSTPSHWESSASRHYACSVVCLEGPIWTMTEGQVILYRVDL